MYAWNSSGKPILSVLWKSLKVRKGSGTWCSACRIFILKYMESRCFVTGCDFGGVWYLALLYRRKLCLFLGMRNNWCEYWADLLGNRGNSSNFTFISQQKRILKPSALSQTVFLLSKMLFFLYEMLKLLFQRFLIRTVRRRKPGNHLCNPQFKQRFVQMFLGFFWL